MGVFLFFNQKLQNNPQFDILANNSHSRNKNSYKNKHQKTRSSA